MTDDPQGGKVLNNQARILESKTTRTGVPYGPGGSGVTPPPSFFKIQPPNIGRSALGMGSEGQGPGYEVRQVRSSESDRTAVGHGLGHGPDSTKGTAGARLAADKGQRTRMAGGHQGESGEVKHTRAMIRGK